MNVNFCAVVGFKEGGGRGVLGQRKGAWPSSQVDIVSVTVATCPSPLETVKTLSSSQERAGDNCR